MFSIINLSVNANVDHFENTMNRAANIADQSMGMAAANADKFQSRFDQASASAAASADKMAGNFQTANENMAASANQTVGALDSISTAADHVDLRSWQDKVAEGFGAGLGAGIVVAQTWLDKVETFVGDKLKVIGIGLAIALVSATAAAVYSAYRIISASMGFLTGLFTGDSYKSANIDAVIALNKEVMTLQNGLQISAQQASALNSALKGQGVDPSAYIKVMDDTANAAHKNTDELDRLGVAYKSADGKLLPYKTTLENARTVLDKYAAGWDRNAAAVAIGMGSYDQIKTVLAVTNDKIADAQQRLVDYNLVIGSGTQKAVADYQTSMLAFQQELDLTSNGFKKAISDQIMPVLTDLSDFFRDGFPFVVNVFRYTMATVTSLFYGLKEAVFVTTEAILQAFKSIGDVVGRVGSSLNKAAHGDLSGAANEMMKTPDDLKNRWELAGKNMVAQSERNAAAMKLAWGADNFSGADPAKKIGTGKVFTPAANDTKDKFAEVDKAIQKTIGQYQALTNATRAAWEASLASEKSYLAESKSLHAQAEAAKPKDTSYEGQALAGLDVTIAKMKLARLSSASGTSYDDIKTQAELVRTLAGNLTDQEKAQRSVSESFEVQSKAAARAAATEKATQPGLRDEWNKSMATVNDLTAAMDSLKKGTQIVVHSDQAKIIVDQMKTQLDALKDKTITLKVVRQDIPAAAAGSSSQSVEWSKKQLPSFAVGTDYVPHDMVAKIHKGERIITAADNAKSGNVVPITMNIPGMGSYPVQASPDVAAEMQTAIRRAALKYGNSR
jgi:hypothetical protein